MSTADVVAQLLAGLREDEEGLYFERATLDEVSGALARLDHAARTQASIPLVALALRVQAEAPGRAAIAVAQLCRVVTSGGVEVAAVTADAKRLLGVTASSKPVGSAKVAGAKSPLDLLLKR